MPLHTLLNSRVLYMVWMCDHDLAKISRIIVFFPTNKYFQKFSILNYNSLVRYRWKQKSLVQISNL